MQKLIQIRYDCLGCIVCHYFVHRPGDLIERPDLLVIGDMRQQRQHEDQEGKECEQPRIRNGCRQDEKSVDADILIDIQNKSKWSDGFDCPGEVLQASHGRELVRAGRAKGNWRERLWEWAKPETRSPKSE